MTRKSYTVIWDEELEYDLAGFWIRASPEIRRELSRSSDEIDRTLGSAPDSVGRPVRAQPGSLIWSLSGYELRIAVVFTIHQDDRVVKVSRIHLSKP